MLATLARRSFRNGILLAVTTIVLVSGTAPARAVSTTFTGTLRVVFGPPGETLFDQTVPGSGSADVSHSGGNVDTIAGLSAGAFTFAGPTFPVTDPDLVPVVSIRLDASSGAGDFSGLTTGGGGTMGIPGQFTAEIFGPGIFLFLLTADGAGAGIGLGGSFLAEPPPASQFQFVLTAAPWTVGTASNSFGSMSGFTSGNTVRLVTPFTYAALFGGIVPTEGFAVLDLEFVPELLQVAIDVRPGNESNVINPATPAAVPVAILGAEDFDVAEIDVSTLGFGPALAPAIDGEGVLASANGDEWPDLVVRFRTRDAGIEPGAEEACIEGQTLNGTPISGCDAIRTVGPAACGLGFEVLLLLGPLVALRRSATHPRALQ